VDDGRHRALPVGEGANRTRTVPSLGGSVMLIFSTCGTERRGMGLVGGVEQVMDLERHLVVACDDRRLLVVDGSPKWARPVSRRYSQRRLGVQPGRFNKLVLILLAHSKAAWLLIPSDAVAVVRSRVVGQEIFRARDAQGGERGRGFSGDIGHA